MKARVSLASAFAALATAALVTAAPALAEPAVVGPPSSIASTGDSITRAFNTCWFPYVDCPSNSWSTGTASWTHYRRILAVNPAISGRTSNHAVTGADMADLERPGSGGGGAAGCIRDDPDGGERRVCVERGGDDADRDVPRPTRAVARDALGRASRRPDLRLEHPGHLPALLDLPVQPRRRLGLVGCGDLPVDAREPALECRRRRRSARPSASAQHRLQHAACRSVRALRPLSLRRKRRLQHGLRARRRHDSRLLPSLGGGPDEARRRSAGARPSTSATSPRRARSRRLRPRRVERS